MRRPFFVFLFCLIVTIPQWAWAADRYWVGGAGSWTSSATTHWAASSGGASGESAPTSADNVIIDVNSDAGTPFTINLGAGATCANFTASGMDQTATISFAAAGLSVVGSWLNDATNFATTSNSNILTFSSTTTGNTIRTNGITLSPQIVFNGAGGGWLLSDALSNNLSGGVGLRFANGTFDANGQTVTTAGLAFGAGTATVVFGSGNWTLNASGTFLTDFSTNSAGKTVTAGTGQIRAASASAKTFAGGGFAYGTLVQAGAGTLTVTGANSFADIQSTAGDVTVTLPASITTTVAAFTLGGTSGHPVTLNSSSSGTAATLSKSSGTVSVSNLSIKDSAATGGATFKAPTAAGNTNVSGNTGWDFSNGNASDLMLLGVGS